jgi:hypothetical protein
MFRIELPELFWQGLIGECVLTSFRFLLNWFLGSENKNFLISTEIVCSSFIIAISSAFRYHPQ